MSKFPAIGEPQPTVESLLNTVQSLKIAVEMLSGQRPGDGAAVTRYEQATPPSNASVGDMWINSSDAGKAYYWNGSYWVDISNSRFEDLVAQAQTAAVSEEVKQELTAEWWLKLAAEHRKITSEIDGAVEQSRTEFSNAITEANAAIETVQTDVDAARDEASAALAAAVALLDADLHILTASDVAINYRIDNIVAVAGGTTAAVDQEALARAAGDNALAAQITSLTSTVNNNKASADSAFVTQSTTNSSLAASISSVSAVAGKQRVFSQSTQPASTGLIVGDLWIHTGDSNKLYYWTGTTWSVREDPRIGQLQASVTAEQIARADADTALAADITTVSAAANRQRVFNQASAPSTTGRIEGDLWYDSDDGFKPYYWNGSAWVDNSDGRYTTIAASVTAEAAARVSGDNALSASITSLTSTVNNNTAAISNEATTRANADSALSASISSLQATSSNNAAAISNEAVTRANADSALSGQITSLTSTVNTNKASLDNEVVARVNGDNALGANIGTLSTTVNGQTAAIQTLTASYNGVAVKYGVTGYINGQTGGFVFTGVSRNDGAASYLMEITANVIINGNLLVTGSVKNQGLEDYAASNSALATGIKSSGNVSLRVRRNSRVACFASYSGNTNDTAADAFLRITANGNRISSVPIPASGRTFPVTTLTVYPGGAGARVTGNGQADASAVYSFGEQYIAYYVWVGYPLPVYATRTISFPATYAFDDSNTSMWLAPKAGSPWVRYVFSTGVVTGVYKVMGFSSAASGSLQGRAPKAWSLQASNNGTNWTTLDTRSNQT